ncbi:protein kinase [Promicromonospora sp. NPDC057138]|uniref:serine/threonine-protein kinase n=1 Tax=Promicromonospora sp. NPDC057138 TaxID=3346031 RepID=UPI00362EDBC7
MTSPAPGVGEIAPTAVVDPGPVPLPEPEPAPEPARKAEPAAESAPKAELADEPTAVEPAAVEPAAVEPAAVEPAAVESAAAEPASEVVPVAEPAPEASPAPDAEPADEPAPEPAATTEPDPEPEEVESLAATAVPDPEPGDEPTAARPAPEPEPAVTLEPEPTGTPAPEPELAAPPEPEPAPAPRAAALPMRPVRRIPASGERMGRFTLAEALGHGGFAHVYRAQADDGEEVALKVLTGLHDDARERFAQEAHLLERLDGRGFPRFVEAGLDATQPWFAMELVPGTTLRDRVREEGPLSGREALRLALQMVDALLVLQEQRCLHRDLKPANIMVDGDRAVLIDLGIAKVFDAATSTQPAGTFSYMAPELFGRRVHPRSDVYSLGLLLVYASTGTLPLDLNFLGRDLVATDLIDEEPDGVVPDEDPLPEPPVIDRHLQSLILAMTRYQPNHRPPLENIAGVLRSRLASTTPDPTLLLTSQVLSDGVTAAEVAALPATDVLPGRGHTKTFLRGLDQPDDATPNTRTPEPWHGLVYDRALMNVLAEVHADGFDGAAEQVVADHVAEIGAHVAGGRTPAEIKDWIWEAMRWRVTSPPDGHADTLRGWRAFRSPEPTPASERASVSGGPGASPRAVSSAPVSSTPARPQSVAATQVVRSMVPPPQSFEPRKSPVKHLGPAPRPAGPSPSVRATRPMPAVQPPAVQPSATRPPAGQQASAGRPPSVQPGVRPGAQPGVQPGVQQRPPAQTPVPPRRRPWPVRLFGALLRWVPRLLLLGAVYLLVTQDPQAGDPFLAAPALAFAALGLAALLRVVGHRMRIWFYVVSTLLVGAAAAALWASSTGLLQLV